MSASQNGRPPACLPTYVFILVMQYTSLIEVLITCLDPSIHLSSYLSLSSWGLKYDSICTYRTPYVVSLYPISHISSSLSTIHWSVSCLHTCSYTSFHTAEKSLLIFPRNAHVCSILRTFGSSKARLKDSHLNPSWLPRWIFAEKNHPTNQIHFLVPVSHGPWEVTPKQSGLAKICSVMSSAFFWGGVHVGVELLRNKVNVYVMWVWKNIT